MHEQSFTRKRKLLNDPVYGFITIPHELIFDIIQHPYFQRLRRITQLGLTNLVYPGANHTRFHHALGATHLMGQAIEELRNKGHVITDDEALGATAAILLHDIGHGPFSHTLECSIVEGINHEMMSTLLMEKLNEEFGGKLETCLAIFNDTYPKRFLHQLVSSQLDMDRLDYLKRDSFFTGVSEGVIGSDRIIKMIDVVNDELAVEEKGIYSIEKFLVARRLMYWQVYLHKTVLVAEFLLMKILQRAKELVRANVEITAPESLRFFMENKIQEADLKVNTEVVKNFTNIDDYDILASIKQWMNHPDKVLSALSTSLINRTLSKIILSNKKVKDAAINEAVEITALQNGISTEEAKYFVYCGKVSNSEYSMQDDQINILFKDGSIKGISQAADILNISVKTGPVTKYYFVCPKDVYQKINV